VVRFSIRSKSWSAVRRVYTEFLINSQDGYSGEEVFEDGLVGSGVIGAKHFFIEFS